MFSLFNFSSVIPGGQLTPFAPMRGQAAAPRTSTQLLVSDTAVRPVTDE